MLNSLSWTGAILAIVLAAAWYVRRSSRRLLREYGGRIDSFKFASRKSVHERLLNDPVIASAVQSHASSNQLAEPVAWKRVDKYIHEIREND